MKSSNFGLYAFCVSAAAAASLAACDRLQPPIGAPGAMARGGGAGPNETVAEYAYVTSEVNVVAVYSLNSATGDLREIEGSPYVAGSRPTAVTIDESGRFAYVADNGSDTITGFAIDARTGRLNEIKGSPFVSDLYPIAAAADPKAPYVYVATQNNTVSAFSIEERSGALRAISGSPYAAGTDPVAICVDSAGRFVYVADEQSNGISAYVIGQRGKLSATSGSPFSVASPTAVGIDPQGRFLYATGSFGNVNVFKINRVSGALTWLMGVDSGAKDPAGITLNRVGRFLYVPDRGTVGGNISSFSVNARTGKPRKIPGSPFGAGRAPYDFSIDPTGTYGYAVDNGGGYIYEFTIDPKTGVLTSKAEWKVYEGPTWMTICASAGGVCKAAPF